jgi:alpha-tubulin suppressor-like RCC1 family protein
MPQPWARVTPVRILLVVGAVWVAWLMCCATPARAYIYWTSSDTRDGPIGRANLDGTGVDHRFITGTHHTTFGIAVDGTHIYWPSGAGGIGRANLDGTDLESPFTTDIIHAGPIAVAGPYIYFGQSSDFGRVNLDGTGETFFPTSGEEDSGGEQNLVGIAVDGAHIYWADPGGNIGRANLDGTGVNTRFIRTDGTPFVVAVDREHVYWTDVSPTSTIARANLDGTGVNRRFIPARNPIGLALDAEHVYWANGRGGTIGRANIDGTGVNQGFVTGAFASSLAVDGLGPTQAPAPTRGLKATAVSAGFGHACALLSNATVKCWGSNESGQLGDGTHTRRLTAVAVQGLVGATSVSASGGTCATLADGTARCWGDNRFGQLGDGTTISRSVPVAVQGLTGVVAVSAGSSSACALLVDHTVACWGDNSRGELGNGTRASSPTPVAVPGLNDITAVSAGDLHACALHVNGTVSCWGWSGRLGPVEDAGDQLTPTLVPSLTDAVTVSGDPFHACALTARAVAECWDPFSPPKIVRGFTNVKAFSFSEDGQQTEHSCAIIVGGTVKCQSPNPYTGQIGVGLTQTKKVVTVTGLHGVTAISTSDFYTCAVLTGGAVKCWGLNDHGQLGDGTTETRFRPVSVRGIDEPATGRATVDVFAGQWGGHERGLRITPSGRATMVVYLGCCTHVINLSFQLSRVRGTYSTATARARVTRVHVFAKSVFRRGRPPHVGQVGTLRLKRGIITEPFLGGTYCNEANIGNCGA